MPAISLEKFTAWFGVYRNLFSNPVWESPKDESLHGSLDG
jgi:hypothetical protein